MAGRLVIHQVHKEYSDVMGIDKQELIDLLWGDEPQAAPPPVSTVSPNQNNAPLGPSTTDWRNQKKEQKNNKDVEDL